MLNFYLKIKTPKKYTTTVNNMNNPWYFKTWTHSRRVAFIRHFAAVYQGYNVAEKMHFVWILTLLIISTRQQWRKVWASFIDWVVNNQSIKLQQSQSIPEIGLLLLSFPYGARTVLPYLNADHFIVLNRVRSWFLKLLWAHCIYQITEA